MDNPLSTPGLTSGTVTSIIVALLGAFSGGTIVALLRIKVDRNEIVVKTAQGAVIVQTGVIDALREELNRLKVETEEWRTEALGYRAEVDQLRRRVAALETRRPPRGRSVD